MKNEIKTMHLFAGIGGGLLADLILGHTPVVAVEWEPYACKVLRERATDGWFPGLQVWEGDVRLFDPSEYTGVVDCIHAGFPCQDISVAGKQAGVSEGTRSGLYREVLRIANVVRPKQLFLENVSAILSNGLGTVLGDLAALGYDCRWLCIRASDVGAPHHRDRWFGLATHTDSNGKPDGPINAEASRLPEFDVAHAICICCGAEKHCCEVDWSQAIRPSSRFGRSSWWATEPELGRVAHGVSNRVGQLKGYGNAQVPLQAAAAYRLLGGL